MKGVRGGEDLFGDFFGAKSCRVDKPVHLHAVQQHNVGMGHYRHVSVSF